MSRKQVYQLDSKRRITFPNDIKEKYGINFAIVRLRDEVLLKPIPKDPVKALQEEGKKLKGTTASQLRKDFEKSLLERG
jgi:bifunctional DNA-binding transcriptional regulator/antitoxin component of YhaV-PrlF toxin-antitoxin module